MCTPFSLEPMTRTQRLQAYKPVLLNYERGKLTFREARELLAFIEQGRLPTPASPPLHPSRAA